MLPVEWILKSQCDSVRWNRQLPGQLEVDASWITLQGASKEEVIIIIVVKTAEERLHRWLRNKEEFLAWNERKNERKESRLKQENMWLSASWNMMNMSCGGTVKLESGGTDHGREVEAG
jgi:hypothetical protein